MAEEADKTEDAAATEEKPSSGSVVPWLLVGLLAAVAGGMVPTLMPASEGTEETEVEPPPFELPEPEDTVFVPFADPEAKDQQIVVNLNEGNLPRYLRIVVQLQVASDFEAEFMEQLKEQRVLLRSWLISRISDKSLEEVRGAAGQNRLRREIQDQFNSILFPDGYDRIYDVLFVEFAVQ